VLNRIGHKDDSVANSVSHTISSALNTNVTVACGIHAAAITASEIEAVNHMVNALVEEFIAQAMANTMREK
jgi:hypothetical protein